MSGGERQRIAIARALLRRPRLLLLDEATSQLDAANEAALRDVIEELADRTTVLVVAHRLSTVRAADRSRCCRTARCGRSAHAELLVDSDELYASFVASQLRLRGPRLVAPSSPIKGDGLGASAHAELAVDLSQVALDRVLRHEAPGDGAVPESLRKLVEHFLLARAQDPARAGHELLDGRSAARLPGQRQADPGHEVPRVPTVTGRQTMSKRWEQRAGLDPEPRDREQHHGAALRPGARRAHGTALRRRRPRGAAITSVEPDPLDRLEQPFGRVALLGDADGAARDERPQAGPHHGAVRHDDRPAGRRWGGLSSGGGTDHALFTA